MKLDLVAALENATWPVFLVDSSGTVRQANLASVAILGTVMEGQPVLAASIWSPENGLSAKDFLQRIERSTSSPAHLKFRVKGGAIAQFHTYVCTVVKDQQKSFIFQLFGEAVDRMPPVVETRPAFPTTASASKVVQSGDTVLLRAAGYTSEANTAQKQKLDCAMQLARTLALDFNNALTGILGHASLILSKLEPTHPWRTSMIEIEKSAQRAAELAQDLAGFTRQEKDVKAQAAGNLNIVVRRAVESFQKSGAKDVLWTLQLEKRLFAAQFDEAKMQQAIMKLLENAVEAVRTDGRISVRTFTQILNEPVLSPALQLGAGHYICLEISDNGCGIPKEVLPRVFEPFFTTKSMGMGTGMGLAVSFGMITAHGGQLQAVDSPSGIGACIRLSLPISAIRPTASQAAKGASPRAAGRRILVVDDEQEIASLLIDILTREGHEADKTSEPAETLNLLAQKTYDAIFCDLRMPAIDGRNLRRKILVEYPQYERRMIFVTGDLLRPGQPSRQLDGCPIVEKPFHTKAILDALVAVGAVRAP